MKRFSILGAAMLATAVLSGCTATNHDADVKAIRDIETEWNQEYVFKSLDKIVDHYAGDAVLMTPRAPASHGSAAIRNSMRALLADPALSMKFNASNIDVARSGDLAYTQGAYTLTITDPKTKEPIQDHGSYVTTYRKQPDGTWKAVADIVSSEQSLGSN